MAGSARGSYLGEVTGKVAERDLAAGIEELDRRVLCMGFRCIFAAQCALKWLKALSPPSDGDCPEGEHDVSRFAAYTKYRGVGRP